MVLGRVGNFVKDMGGAVQNVAKTASWAANPTHIDDIARGTVKTAQFVAENPGVVKDVGVQILKEELKPQNLAITAALTAATIATGGAAAPAAIAARAAWAGRAGKAGVTGIRAAKAVEEGVEISKAARYTKRAVELGKSAEKAIDAGKEGGRLARGIEKVNEVRRTVSPITTRMHEFRTGLGEKVLEGGTGPLRQAAANVVQGTGGIGRTTRMAGQSERAYQAQQHTRYVKMARTGVHVARAAPTVASAAADPQGYAMKKAMEGDFGPKMGDTGEYEYEAGGVTKISENESGLDVTDNGVIQPAGWGERTALRGAQKLQNFGAGVAASNQMGGPNAFWKGPGREAMGGISSNYDWRKFEMRPVQQVTRSSAFGQGQLGALTQPGTPGTTPPTAPMATAGSPLKPPTLPPQKMAASAMYSGGAESATTATAPQVRFLPKSGSTPRGGKPDHSTFYGSGKSTENVSQTITGPGPAWNEDMEGSMTWDTSKPLVEPAKSNRKGGIGDYGLGRIRSQLPNAVESAPGAQSVQPLQPLQPIKKPQTVGA